MTPDFEIVTDGNEDVTRIVAQKLVSLSIRDERGEISDSVEIVLDDGKAEIALPRKGVRLSVAIGYAETGLVDKGRFQVDEIALSGPPDHLTIRAQEADALGDLKSQRSRPWHETTIGAIVAAIAADHGLQPMVAPGLAERVILHRDQRAESDKAFLNRLATDYGAITKPIDGKLVFAVAAQGTSIGGIPIPPVTLRRGDIGSWRVTLPEIDAFNSFIARYHDIGLAELISVTAGEGEPVSILPGLYADAEEARAAAEAALAASRRSRGTLSLTLPGRPELKAGGLLTLEGLREVADRQWAIRRVSHRIDVRGYRTEVDAELPG